MGFVLLVQKDVLRSEDWTELIWFRIRRSGVGLCFTELVQDYVLRSEDLYRIELVQDKVFRSWFVLDRTGSG